MMRTWKSATPSRCASRIKGVTSIGTYVPTSEREMSGVSTTDASAGCAERLKSVVIERRRLKLDEIHAKRQHAVQRIEIVDVDLEERRVDERIGGYAARAAQREVEECAKFRAPDRIDAGEHALHG